ncbi:MAG TPA: hypothetical protein PK440_12650, partial [Candidatus Accumulibacter phosphatis]|nr:hypothetical protein [Candidatus Accumulibacter phosphatis]
MRPIPIPYPQKPIPWIDGRQPGELRRYLNHRLVDQHRYRVEIAGVALQPQPLRFERQRTAAGEGVMKSRQP